MPARMEALARSFSRRSGATLLVGVSEAGERTLGRWGPRGQAAAAPSVLEIGSLTKPLTGALLADMHRRREVRLGDRLQDHLPQAAAWPAGRATLVELATHRSGLPNTPRAMLVGELAMLAGLRREDPWEAVDRAAYEAMLAPYVPRRGRAIRYSSVGYGLLGDALARAARRPYGDLLRERLLDPLGMHDSGVERPVTLPGHSGRGRPRPPMHDRMVAAGGVRATVPDLLSWLEACLAAPAGRVGGALAMAQRPRVRGGRGLRLGLGWMIVPARGDRPAVVWHNGLTYGYRSFGGFVPATGKAAVALSNSTRSLDRLGLALLTGVS